MQFESLAFDSITDRREEMHEMLSCEGMICVVLVLCVRCCTDID